MGRISQNHLFKELGENEPFCKCHSANLRHDYFMKLYRFGDHQSTTCSSTNSSRALLFCFKSLHQNRSKLSIKSACVLVQFFSSFVHCLCCARGPSSLHSSKSSCCTWHITHRRPGLNPLAAPSRPLDFHPFRPAHTWSLTPKVHFSNFQVWKHFFLKISQNVRPMSTATWQNKRLRTCAVFSDAIWGLR